MCNGEIRPNSDRLISPGQTGYLNGWGVFSTLRVYDGVLFAYERHYARMVRDAQLVRVSMPVASGALHGWLLQLVSANKVVNGTLRVAIVRNKGGAFEGGGGRPDCDVVAFTTDLTDWGAGVRLYYVANARYSQSPFSGTKVTSWVQNLTWNEEAHERGYDEVILLNERAEISECTSANVFAIDGSEVVTPPVASSGCLPGITRAILLEEIRIPGFEFKERDLTPKQLEVADQVFITSTTRNLLSVISIESKPLGQRPEVLSELNAAFTRYQAAYRDRCSLATSNKG
jgi:branched-subunit amino acid aminotransferase/4-amino-4-deoxychorismate lyase